MKEITLITSKLSKKNKIKELWRYREVTTISFHDKNVITSLYFHNSFILFFFEDLNLKELKEKAQYCYIKIFFEFFYRAKSNVNNCEYDLRELKKRFIYNIPRIINNNIYNIKEKTLWIIFIISPKVYEAYNKYSWK